MLYNPAVVLQYQINHSFFILYEGYAVLFTTDLYHSSTEAALLEEMSVL